MKKKEKRNEEKRTKKIIDSVIDNWAERFQFSNDVDGSIMALKASFYFSFCPTEYRKLP